MRYAHLPARKPVHGPANKPEERRISGFTLIEVTVAMLIFAIAMGVLASGIVVRDRTPSPYDMAKKIQAMAFNARSEAILSNRLTMMVIDTKAGTLRYRKSDDVVLPGGQSIKVLAGRELVLADGRVAVTFLPDGSSSGAEISLGDEKERTARVEIHWLTGLARISAGASP